MAGRRHPRSEVRGGGQEATPPPRPGAAGREHPGLRSGVAARELPCFEARGGQEKPPRTEARGGGPEEPPHTEAGAAAGGDSLRSQWLRGCRRALRSYHVDGQEGRW